MLTCTFLIECLLLVTKKEATDIANADNRRKCIFKAITYCREIRKGNFSLFFLVVARSSVSEGKSMDRDSSEQTDLVVVS